MSKPQVYVVVGASRGLGLEHIKQLATRTPAPIVFAAVRSPSTATDINNFASAHPNVHVLAADLASATSFTAAANIISQQVDGIDVLIVNGAQWEAGKVLEDIDSRTHTLIDVNSFGPLRALRGFLPLLKKRNTKKVVFISSSAGSVTVGLKFGAVFGLQVPYNASKATLNFLTSQVAQDLKGEGFTIIPLCPGMVATDMATSAMNVYPPEVVAEMKKDPTFKIQTPTESVTKQLAVIDSLTPAQTGTFLNNENKVVPW